MPEKIAVIGGGISGLSAAFFALQKGHDLSLFESSSQLGGLAGSFDFDGLNIERYYHFICGGDDHLLDFADRVGVGDKVRFRETKLSFYYNGRFYAFGTPLNLLMFKPISLISRIKFGLNVISSKYSKTWEKLDKISAREWLIRCIGEQAYQVIWHPLLKVKFGSYYDRISAAWIWHRIHRVATSRKGIFAKEKLGYFQGGTQSLIDAAEAKITELGGKIHRRARVEGIEKDDQGWRLKIAGAEAGRFDKVVFAVPLPVASKLVRDVDADYAARLGSIDFIGVVCGLFRLKKQLNEAFWLNINDPRVPANGLIEYTNLNPLDGISDDKIVYIPFYVPLDDAWFAKDDEAIKQGFTEILKSIRPDITAQDILGFRAFKSPHAQAICTTRFKDRVPSMAAPLENLFLIDSTQLYPSDRSLSGLIGLANRLVDTYL
ncbi:MAG: NAD(P)/FAD-dependent oxidoreductase [Planctomycetes bacterium]|nr:NAD(P)/FAD-dependent oxidoreductase [Planctomycetota bacterium]